MAMAYTSRDVIGDRSAAAGCLAMIYTVYKGVGCGMCAESADLHDTTQTVNINLTHLRVVPDLDPQVDGRAQRIKTVFLMCDLKQTHIKREKVPYQFQRPQIRQDVCSIGRSP